MLQVILTIVMIMIFVLGFLTGTVLALGRMNRMDVGTFTINETDPKKELFAINFEKDLDEFKNKDAITFRILRK